MSRYIENSEAEPYQTILPKRFSKWKCIWCWESIVSNEQHWHYAGYWEHMKQNWRMHNECYCKFKEDWVNSEGTINQGAHKRGSLEVIEERL